MVRVAIQTELISFLVPLATFHSSVIVLALHAVLATTVHTQGAISSFLATLGRTVHPGKVDALSVPVVTTVLLLLASEVDVRLVVPVAHSV